MYLIIDIKFKAANKHCYWCIWDPTQHDILCTKCTSLLSFV